MRKSVFLTMALMLTVFYRVSAQVTVELGVDEDEFLPGESLPVAVKIINRSGQVLHLGADASWLAIDVESLDGSVVKRLSDPPVEGAFDLLSSQMATKHLDIAPAFELKATGRYKVTATVHIREWGTDVRSKPMEFSIVHGGKLWDQTFGLPSTNNQAPEVRKYELDEANYLHSQIRLYVQVSDQDELHLFKVFALGPMVSFGQPEEQVDGQGQLHVLWQSGSSVYAYRVITPDGDLAREEIYDYVTTRPRLTVNELGRVIVVGGVRRLKASEMPMVKSPTDLQ